jgi:hypothetical protein
MELDAKHLYQDTDNKITDGHIENLFDDFRVYAEVITPPSLFVAVPDEAFSVPESARIWVRRYIDFKVDHLPDLKTVSPNLHKFKPTVRVSAGIEGHPVSVVAPTELHGVLLLFVEMMRRYAKEILNTHRTSNVPLH